MPNNTPDTIRLCKKCHIAFDKKNGFWGNPKGNEKRRIAKS